MNLATRQNLVAASNAYRLYSKPYAGFHKTELGDATQPRWLSIFPVVSQALAAGLIKLSGLPLDFDNAHS